MTPDNLLTEWARLLVESLADAGLRDVVVSPGSRSTPLTWAFVSSPRFRCESIVDERAAAFYAVGSARITGRPAAVVCTSGSAAANYFPAIVEASMARIPLLVITADRPFELQDCSAPQTLDQTKLYGDYVRRFADVGMPESSETALIALRRRAAQSLFDTLSGEPGPVHLNVRARKPLEPVVATSALAQDLTTRVDALLRAPLTSVTRARRVPTDEAVERVAQDCMTEERGVIVCGPSPFGSAETGSVVARLAIATGYPVYAETTSQLRLDGLGALPRPLVLDGLDVLLRSTAFRERFRPRVVLQIGEPPTSGNWERLLGTQTDLARHVIASHGWPDPQGSARSLIVADVEETLSRLAAALASRRQAASGSWSERLAIANEAAWSAVDRVLSTETTLSEGSAVRAAVNAVPEGGLLVVGNSLPVRHVDVFCRARPTSRIGVCSQRGVSGIDGLVSGATGAARSSRRPTLLVLGDVSALHDLGGFATAAAVDVPFVVVVLNNDGGRIFEQLPLSEAGLAEDQLRFWTTPHGAHFDGLARLFRIGYASVTTLGELGPALEKGLSRTGCTVVEVAVPPGGARAHYAAVASLADAALGALGDPAGLR